jgi:hypothetical protein
MQSVVEPETDPNYRSNVIRQILWLFIFQLQCFGISWKCKPLRLLLGWSGKVWKCLQHFKLNHHQMVNWMSLYWMLLCRVLRSQTVIPITGQLWQEKFNDCLFFSCNAFAFYENASRCDYYRVEAEKYESVSSISNRTIIRVNSATTSCKYKAGNHYWRERISTVDLLVPTESDQLLFILWLYLFLFLQNNLT